MLGELGYSSASSVSSDPVGARATAVLWGFFSCPLYFFPFPLFYSCLHPLFICLVSFLLFPCASVWENLVHEFHLTIAIPNAWILTWILGVASKHLSLLHGRVGDSTTLVNSLSPKMGLLVEDVVASCCGVVCRMELLFFLSID